jgi:ABC-type lipoprotein export system ATPase subunit
MVMSIPDQQDNIGAQFLKADLHIHSYGTGGSYDVTDVEMTPQAIVDVAVEKGLRIISITDHNEIVNSELAINYSSGKNVVVLPGVELSTIQGHLLVYFEKYSQLKSFFNKLEISEDKKQCNHGILDCLNRAKEYGGIGVLAHIEKDAGFWGMSGRVTQFMPDIFKHDALLGLEITDKGVVHWFVDKDEDQQRAGLNKLRNEQLKQTESSRLAKVMNSDSHKLHQLGKNADGERKLTRYKMNSPSFHGLKLALMSPGSRVRLEYTIPESYPRIREIRIEGGLFNQDTVQFNHNLNCIIGGRGSGKSTLLESLKVGLGHHTESKLIDSDVWPSKIYVTCEDESGQIHNFEREKYGDVINVDDRINGIIKFPIEYYAQGATAAEINFSDGNPQNLLKFIDGFIETHGYRLDEEIVLRELKELQRLINQGRQKLKNLPEVQRQLSYTKSIVENYKKQNVGDLYRLQEALHRERQVRESLIASLNDMKDSYQHLGERDVVFQSIESVIEIDVESGKEAVAEIRRSLSELQTEITTIFQTLNNTIDVKINSIELHIATWAQREKAIQQEIDLKKAALESQKIPFDISEFNKHVASEMQYEKQLRSLQEEQVEVEKNIAKKNELILRRKSIKQELYKRRLAWALKMNQILGDSIDGYRVDIKIGQGRFSPSFEHAVKTKMDYRTTSVYRAKALSEAMSPIEFTEYISKKNRTPFKQILDQNKEVVFSEDDISRIYDRYSSEEDWSEYEAMEFDDLPSIVVTKKPERPTDVAVSKSISKLSLGQQQSIILSILLHSENKWPLLIDQPEDNLDNEFIFNVIVQNLRKVKEVRQVIVVTHNPNIAVLGDAELVLPLKSTSAKSYITDKGAIDNENTRKLSCTILEGGESAFRQRKSVYGI